MVFLQADIKDDNVYWLDLIKIKNKLGNREAALNYLLSFVDEKFVNNISHGGEMHE